jgi:hypothetical protein
MKSDSLRELKAAFDRWRRRKRHVREPVPDELRERARRAIQVHGLKGVVRATKLERARLAGKVKSKKTGRAALPSFSRLGLPVPSATTSPIVEIETATGVKLRIFAQTQETLSLMSSLCGIGGMP